MLCGDGLEFLSQNEVELTAAFGAKHFVEAVSPVDTHQTYHRKEDANTQSGTAFDLEGVEFLGLGPGISAFDESESIDRGVTQHEGITQLQSHTRIGIAFCSVRRKRTVLVSTQANGLFCISRRITTHTVTTHVIGFKGRLLVFVIRTQQSEFYASHEHETFLSARESSVSLRLELPFMILYPTEFLLLLS